MTLQQLKDSVRESTPLSGMPPAIVALWHDARGDWDAAHRVAQDLETADGAWVHAYLHRKEGDASNAAYWYRRAGRPIAKVSLDEEWQQIAGALLEGIE